MPSVGTCCMEPGAECKGIWLLVGHLPGLGYDLLGGNVREFSRHGHWRCICWHWQYKYIGRSYASGALLLPSQGNLEFRICWCLLRSGTFERASVRICETVLLTSFPMGLRFLANPGARLIYSHSGTVRNGICKMCVPSWAPFDTSGGRFAPSFRGPYMWWAFATLPAKIGGRGSPDNFAFESWT